jgi:hypothetical protein
MLLQLILSLCPKTAFTSLTLTPLLLTPYPSKRPLIASLKNLVLLSFTPLQKHT